MAESEPSKPKTTNSTVTGFSRHIGNETTWYVFNTAPDYCRVGNSVVGFDTFAELSVKSSASPNVKAQLGGKPVYRVGDFVSGVQANAGQGVRSTTSLSSGYVKFLNGQANVKVNGIPVVMDGTRCIINCNKAGVGGTTAVLRTATKTVTSKAPAERSVADRVGDESLRVVNEKWNGAKEAAGTVWEALPWTSSDATSAAARKTIGEGVMGSLEGLATLMGPPPDMAQAAYMSGDASSIALVEEMQARQQQALGAIVDQVKDSWVQAEARNGVAGASAMVLVTLGIEIVGGKGAGVLGKVAMRVGEIVRMAKTPLEAASLLEKELVAARAAGKSADELRVLTKARDERLAQARKEAADPKGKEGAHVAKGRLEPNAKYTLNGYDYTTDAHGRIKSVEGELRLESADRDNYAQRTVGAGDGRLPDDHGGHMIGSQFGGHGGKENLTPMAEKVNNYHSGEWGKMEKEWAERLRAGDSVHVRIEPIYNSETLRPDSFDVIETINRIPLRKNILNPGR